MGQGEPEAFILRMTFYSTNTSINSTALLYKILVKNFSLRCEVQFISLSKRGGMIGKLVLLNI